MQTRPPQQRSPSTTERGSWRYNQHTCLRARCRERHVRRFRVRLLDTERCRGGGSAVVFDAWPTYVVHIVAKTWARHCGEYRSRSEAGSVLWRHVRRRFKDVQPGHTQRSSFLCHAFHVELLTFAQKATVIHFGESFSVMGNQRRRCDALPRQELGQRVWPPSCLTPCLEHAIEEVEFDAGTRAQDKNARLPPNIEKTIVVVTALLVCALKVARC